MQHKIMVLDLEANQPSEKIIQIGAVVLDVNNGDILERYSSIINCNEILDPFIIELTGITQEQTNNGDTLLEGYNGLVSMAKKHKTFINFATWGVWDFPLMREQIKLTYPDVKWMFGRRFLDVKCIFQSMMFFSGLSTKSGLNKSLNRLGLSFNGEQHDAMYDAENTAKIYNYMCQKLILP